MEVLHFTLKGRAAFFKKPEVNSYVYFTYGNIHKVALLGMFGAILGYGGYTKKYNETGKAKQIEESFPEFYEKLSKLKVAVRPNAEKGFIPKKIQAFNNSVGYASKEMGESHSKRAMAGGALLGYLCIVGQSGIHSISRISAAGEVCIYSVLRKERPFCRYFQCADSGDGRKENRKRQDIRAVS